MVLEWTQLIGLTQLLPGHLVDVLQCFRAAQGCWDYYQYIPLAGVVFEKEGMAEYPVDLVSRDILLLSSH